MDSLTIQGNTYELEMIDNIIKANDSDYSNLHAAIYKRFQKDIYTTYKQIRHIHKPKACEKLSLEKVKANLRDHWLEIYLNLTREEAETVIEYAELFFGLAIK
ncbi:TPA: hypothetical protein QCU24_002226 [Bacillus cereus]|uniref:Uncharacterized protein n=1 Tax=Bacillus thuringiensis serovar subtoxicus TaxID=475791 RepID=A0A9X6II68_BACTU|nr:hypothetical protein [Bacillus thuringiensis]MEB8583000.1 hypothetical protein [Bacillus cereus]MEB8615027.1 hypothetical protein [Bacillus cereus]MEB8617723.1 hypothetical protein [Bacillus cereus]MEB8682473.1 hypothetical protein [Bacillus cereus]MEB8832741.1 hypothetical protein [Bacillus cereus]